MTQMCCQVVSPSPEQRYRIERIAALTPCRRGFVCLTSRFQNLGRLVTTDPDRAAKCLEPDGAKCNLAVLLRDGTYCACLVRLYIATTFDLQAM
jgi:hypothetical protein